MARQTFPFLKTAEAFVLGARTAYRFFFAAAALAFIIGLLFFLEYVGVLSSGWRIVWPILLMLTGVFLLHSLTRLHARLAALSERYFGTSFW